MELELGLALRPVNVPKQNLDLNISSFEGSESASNFSCLSDFKKRSFAESFDYDDDEYYCISKTPSSLLVWDGGRRPNDGKEGNRRNFDGENLQEEAEGENVNGIVGWPPIKSWRKKLIQNPHRIILNNNQMGCGRMIINGRRSRNNNHGTVIRNNNSNNSSIYVKVKMEGVAIGRKINLMLFNSYQSLLTTLLNMFSRYRENDKDKGGACCSSYILSYLDKEGDWLLAGDVPWQIFIGTVQRIEITKQSS